MLQAAGPENQSSAAVSLLDWYTLDEEVILVMERPIPSDDLHQHVILKQLVEAAADMISKGVFHRDIKMSNLLIDTSSDVPEVRVIDFGCGCYAREKPYTRFSGTRAYFPPEWFSKGKYQACPTMVWQIGAVLYMVLHGKKFSTQDFLSNTCKTSKRLSKGKDTVTNVTTVTVISST
ncbi:hypothetical protein LDENG_00184410 [Lucifuga dentata]|nr:hypothetical protein LDENG_00184410 [Lucifuga dentata]